MIRNARKEDADFVAPLLFQAMSEIVFKFIGEENLSEGIAFLKYLFLKEENQYSYQNILVFEQENKVVGVLNFYNGADLEKLRNPVLKYIAKNYKRTISVEAETQSGEWYIDTLGVAINYQKKGVATKLLQFLKNEKKGEKIGLLVEENNESAQRLYCRLGFENIGKKTLVGGIYYHFVIIP